MVCYGYLRVSTVKQEEANYKASILNMANEKNLGQVIWIQETISGRKDWKNRLLGKSFNQMKEGDVIIMAEFSRIGRNFLQSIDFLCECRRRGVIVYSCNNDIPQTDDATSMLLLSLTSWKAQVEREDIARRTKVGLKYAKERGVILGRKKRMILDINPENKDKIKELLNKGVKLKYIAKDFKCTVKTLSKFIKKHELKDTQITNNE